MAEDYISTRKDIAQWRDELDSVGKKLVLTNGCFDLLHAGHVRYLKEARELGDALVVAINSDESVTELKGPNRPVYPEEDRAEILCALECVDRVVVFGEKRASQTIEGIRPHIYTKGGDYTPDNLIDEEKALLDRLGIEIRILSLVPGRSTSETLAKSSNQASARPKIAILGSGRGSNSRSIIESVKSGEIDAEVGIVISDVEDSGVLRFAREAGVPAIFVEPGTDKSGQLSNAACKEIADKLKASRIDLVALCGFMRIVRGPILDEFEGKIINLHPSLLPLFPGRNAWKQALDAGVTESGCTIHFVDSGVDTGEIIRQISVPVLPEDDVETLRKRINEEEIKLYPEVIASLLKKS